MADGTEVNKIYVVGELAFQNVSNNTDYYILKQTSNYSSILEACATASEAYARRAWWDIELAKNAFKAGLWRYISHLPAGKVNQIREELDKDGWNNYSFLEDLSNAPFALFHDIRLITGIRFADVQCVKLINPFSMPVGTDQLSVKYEPKSDTRFEDLDI